MNNAKKITNVIKEKWEKSNIELGDICQMLDVKESYFLNCISGKKNFSCAEFLSLCNFLDLNLDDFKNCIC